MHAEIPAHIVEYCIRWVLCACQCIDWLYQSKQEIVSLRLLLHYGSMLRIKLVFKAYPFTKDSVLDITTPPHQLPLLLPTCDNWIGSWGFLTRRCETLTYVMYRAATITVVAITRIIKQQRKLGHHWPRVDPEFRVNPEHYKFKTEHRVQHCSNDLL